ncbi:HNH endonuclease [Aliivibrio sp. EL58]|uniref:HNH endonuclease n=1 Tax=Aliivibrio sp. EL58 TaxID=2107582 RepID=UPI000EFB92FD|nr:HNH endonuclease [Aliivibrio sp. EL58]
MGQNFNIVFERDKNRCVYCGKDLLSDFESFMSAEEDHLIPKSKGGSDLPSNIVTSCNVCNRLKHNFVAEGFENMDISQIIDSARTHIMKKRAEKLKDFMSWTIYDQKQYFT